MPRYRRFLVTDRPARYSISDRLAGDPAQRLLAEPRIRRECELALRRWFAIYTPSCRMVRLVDGGWQLLVLCDPRRRIGRRELRRRAARLWPEPCRRPKCSGEWRRFRCRLFDLSALMKDLKGTLSRRVNRLLGRRGPLWAERFRTVLLDRASLRVYWSYLVEVAETPETVGVVEEKRRQSDAGWDRARRRQWGMRLRGLLAKRQWQEQVAVWEWGRVIGERGFVEYYTREDIRQRDLRWQLVPLGVADLWTIRGVGIPTNCHSSA